MSIQSMTGILNQIQFQARQASGLNTSGSVPETAGNGTFSDMLMGSINAVSQAQTTAKSQAQAYMSGASGIELNDVMVSLQKSSLALNLGVQVRNKMVSAYQEIMGMSL
ncbi:flagellar hook-basal body complex protein FliE [Enterobacter sp. BIGb0383]|uniref:flagellar hook-basal body complex protein FliE n=1 Tax=unclassified Enterobacter TaxID=2608935 RepID=UPI000F488D10|nr:MULTISPECIES: flagellar hook-basal body complex protein FliE [unclassified Enterobacter]ROP58327.1 flagellar hook-basal body complex protein FliE [Enterobacter sp. BIGb0383]ROS06785.1 flagellar hook-basal body complex protein FliE [Enterobacter sp. BIGb0359]